MQVRAELSESQSQELRDLARDMGVSPEDLLQEALELYLRLAQKMRRAQAVHPKPPRDLSSWTGCWADVELSPEAQDQLQHILENPEAPTEELIRAMSATRGQGVP
jgi:hypothetical protein